MKLNQTKQQMNRKYFFWSEFDTANNRESPRVDGRMPSKLKGTALIIKHWKE